MPGNIPRSHSGDLRLDRAMRKLADGTFFVDGLALYLNAAGQISLRLATAILNETASGLGFANEAANVFFAGPSTGAAAGPTFRVLVAADLTGLVVASFNTRTGAVTLSQADVVTALGGQQTDGAALVNNVTAGGTTNTIANFTDLTVYANDAAAIRNDLYQLARKVKIIDDALRALGLLS